MTRLSRKEMQKQTRERLLAAAEAEIARQGIDGASIRDISEAAGYSLGAFYSNFPSKDALLRELQDRHMRAEALAFREIVSGAGDDGTEQALDKVGAWLRGIQGNRTLIALAIEFHLYASRQPSFRKEFEKSKAKRHAELAAGLETLFRRMGRTPPLAPLQMASAFAALWVGFAIHGNDVEGLSAEEAILFFLRLLLDGRN